MELMINQMRKGYQFLSYIIETSEKLRMLCVFCASRVSNLNKHIRDHRSRAISFGPNVDVRRLVI